MRLIHMTDPHLTSLQGIAAAHFTGKRWLGHQSWRWRRRKHLRSHLDELCAAAQALQPDLILVTGDLVHLGLVPEVEAAAEWLGALGPPERIMVVPGNHDLYRGDAWAAVEAHWASYLHLNTGSDASSDAAHGESRPYWARFPSHLRRDGIELHGLNSGGRLPSSPPRANWAPPSAAAWRNGLPPPRRRPCIFSPCIILRRLGPSAGARRCGTPGRSFPWPAGCTSPCTGTSIGIAPIGLGRLGCSPPIPPPWPMPASGASTLRGMAAAGALKCACSAGGPTASPPRQRKPSRSPAALLDQPTGPMRTWNAGTAKADGLNSLTVC